MSLTEHNTMYRSKEIMITNQHRIKASTSDESISSTIRRSRKKSNPIPATIQDLEHIQKQSEYESELEMKTRNLLLLVKGAEPDPYHHYSNPKSNLTKDLSPYADPSSSDYALNFEEDGCTDNEYGAVDSSDEGNISSITEHLFDIEL